jgi:glyoxylase-like metal-dependent hydrolase (beta-lactamase superfamily II)
MIVKTLIVGTLATNCYIVHAAGKREAIVIDPGSEAKRIYKYLVENKLKARYIVATHGHYDHIGSISILAESTQGRICIHELDFPLLSNPNENLAFWLGDLEHKIPSKVTKLKDGDSLQIEEIKLIIRHTPGHTRGSLTLCGDQVLFTGDLIFRESVGRTDLPGGSFEKLIASLKELISNHSEETIIYPGHGPATTIGYEKTHNPYLLGI